jgi:hypothetical protein
MSRLLKKRHWKMRETIPLVEDRLVLINKVIRNTLKESFDREIPTEYKVLKEYTPDYEIVIYRFNTNNSNSYDLEFISTVRKINGIKTETMDIAFVPSEINMSDRDNSELYNKETNRDETFELMGRINYLVKEFINNNPNICVYVIGKDTKDMKLKIYNKMYENIFSNDFTKTEGSDYYYENGVFFFTKKNMEKNKKNINETN